MGWVAPKTSEKPLDSLRGGVCCRCEAVTGRRRLPAAAFSTPAGISAQNSTGYRQEFDAPSQSEIANFYPWKGLSRYAQNPLRLPGFALVQREAFDDMFV